MRRALPWLAIAGFAIGCGGVATTSSATGATAPATDDGATAVDRATSEYNESAFLPAGLYWEAYGRCAQCPGKVVLVATVADDLAAAQKALDAANSFGLPLGYPFVTHAAQVQLPEKMHEKIFVIYGIFATDAEANKLAAAVKSKGAAPQLIAAPDEDSGHGRDIVVHFQPGVGPVRAYRKSDIMPDKGPRIELHYDDNAEAKLAALTPLCEIDRGTLFHPSRKELEWYSWVPVDCNGELAFVDWRETRLMTIYFRADASKGERARVRQVAIVECDTPYILDWPIDKDGAKAGKPTEVKLGSEGC